MRLKLNGIDLAAPADPIPPKGPIDSFWSEVVRGHNELWDWHSPFWEGNKEVVRQHFDPGAWLELKIQAIGHTLAVNSPEIIAVGVCVCALLAMIAPLLGSPTHRWLSRTFIVFFLGAIWRAFL